MDRRAIIGHIAAKYDIKMDESDPAFLLVEMNQLALEAATSELVSGLQETNVKLVSSIGAIAGAIAEMNTAADNLVESKLIDLQRSVNNVISGAIKDAINESIQAAIAKEIHVIRKEVNDIAGSMRKMHTTSARSHILAAAGAGALAAMLTLGVAWWAVSSGKLPIDVRVDSGSVAQTVLEGVKNLPKTR